jgi:hypothetical protein
MCAIPCAAAWTALVNEPRPHHHIEMDCRFNYETCEPQHHSDSSLIISTFPFRLRHFATHILSNICLQCHCDCYKPHTSSSAALAPYLLLDPLQGPSTTSPPRPAPRALFPSASGNVHRGTSVTHGLGLRDVKSGFAFQRHGEVGVPMTITPANDRLCASP